MNKRTTRGDFTQQAEFYGRARPSYPRDLVVRLLDDASVHSGSSVLEVGAGTGLFTQLLSEHRLKVTAVEPNDVMRAYAPELEGVTQARGSFEETGVPDGSQEWVVAAQAFHWANPPRALPELHRVLVPRACFTVLWNVRDVARSDILAWTLARIEELAVGFDEGYRGVDWSEVLTSTGHFSGVRTYEHPHVVRMSAGRYLDLWRSHNHLNSSAAPEDVAKLLIAIEQRLDELDLDEVDVPYTSKSWTVRSR